MNYHRDIEDFLKLQDEIQAQTSLDSESQELVDFVDAEWARKAPGGPSGLVPFP